MTLSNELTASVFFTPPEIHVMPSRMPDISLSLRNSPSIVLHIVGTSKTPSFTDTSGLTLLSIPKDTKIGDFLVQTILLVQLRQTQEDVLAETWLEGVYEYGTSLDVSEAVTDLIVSLGEYLDVLQAREEQLGDSAKRELNALRKLVKRDN